MSSPTAPVRTAIRVPKRSLIGGWTLLVAALLASPVLWLLNEGLISVTDVLIRYLLVLAGCVAVTTLVRGVWPALSGQTREDSTKNTPPAPAEPERAEWMDQSDPEAGIS